MMMTYDCAVIKDIEDSPVLSEKVADTFSVEHPSYMKNIPLISLILFAPN